MKYKEDIWVFFFFVKDRNLFHIANIFGNIFTSGAARWNNFQSFTGKKTHQIFYLFHAFNPFWEELYQNPVQFFSAIPRGVPLPHSNALQYYVKREKLKVNDVIFPSGCEARAINLGNKNMKIGIFTGVNIFTTVSRFPTGKHEIKTTVVEKKCRQLQFLYH